MSYLTLDSYTKNTSSKEERQDITVSKCLGGVCAVGSNSCNANNRQQIKENYEEPYGTISLRGSVRPPYGQQWNESSCSSTAPLYPAVT